MLTRAELQIWLSDLRDIEEWILRYEIEYSAEALHLYEIASRIAVLKAEITDAYNR